MLKAKTSTLSMITLCVAATLGCQQQDRTQLSQAAPRPVVPLLQAADGNLYREDCIARVAHDELGASDACRTTSHTVRISTGTNDSLYFIHDYGFAYYFCTVYFGDYMGECLGFLGIGGMRPPAPPPTNCWNDYTACSPVPWNGDSGIAGMVTQGPINPVSLPGVPNTGPAAGVVVQASALDAASSAKTYSATTRTDGSFSLALPPGTYGVSVAGRRPGGATARKTVQVSFDSYARVTFPIDTGIR